MSTRAATVSKPSRLERAGVKPRASQARLAASTPAKTAPPVASAVPITGVELVPLLRLRRAPENVRHIRADEDIAPLADDIQAHGLLQNLIGYRGDDLATGAGPATVWIVGGGRRLQALGILIDDREVIDGDYQVPVLIRPRSDAIEISLSENLAKRDMSPVDECRAFAQLMDIGTNSPLDLAKRFGFSETYVKQRLRLANLADPILDALANKKLTLDSAMAYAGTEDHDLQAAVFKQQSRSKWDQHAPNRIRADYSAAQATTASPIFTFVGAETYERDGGRYDDDLFSAAETASGARRLMDGTILNAAAERMIRFQAIRIEAELAGEFPSCFEGFVLPPNLRVDGYPWKAPTAPKGKVLIDDAHGLKQEAIWKNLAKEAIPFAVIVGINELGELEYSRRKLFVDKDGASKVKPSTTSASQHTPPSPEEIARRKRENAIDTKQWRLGVGSFVGTPWEGRAFWPSGAWRVAPIETTEDPGLQDGKLVTVQIYVTHAEHAALREEAERRVDEAIAQAAAAEKQAANRKEVHPETIAGILNDSPPPAVVVIDGGLAYRHESGSYVKAPGLVDEEDPITVAEDLSELLGQADVGALIETFATVEGYLATLPADAARTMS